MKVSLTSLLLLTCTVTFGQSVRQRFTISPFLGVKRVTWQTGLPTLPRPFEPGPLTQETGFLPNLGAMVQYQMESGWRLTARTDAFWGHTRLDGQFGTFVGVDRPRVAAVTDQRVRWSGWSGELMVDRAISLSERIRVAPQLVLAYQAWSHLPPPVPDPLVVVYQSNFRWLRAGIGAELSIALGDHQRLYLSPSLRLPLSVRHQVSNFRTIDDFAAMRENIDKQGIDPEGADGFINVTWKSEKPFRKVDSKTTYAVEAGWVGNGLQLSVLLETIQANGLAWFPHADATGTFTTLRVGVPIRFKERHKPQPGYFMPSQTPKP